MQNRKFNKMLKDVAKFEGISVEQAYKMLQDTINAAQNDPDPIIQARWKDIPHKGKTVTVEEFFEYMDKIGPYGMLPFSSAGKGFSS